MCNIQLGDILYSPAFYVGATAFFRVVEISKNRKVFKIRELKHVLSEKTKKYVPINEFFEVGIPGWKPISVKPHESVDCLLYKNKIGIYPYSK